MESRAIINVIDNLNSTSVTDALSANQGRVLKGMINNVGSNLPLLKGTDNVRCKKQGNIVFIEGAVKGVTTKAREIGVLPEGYRPTGKQVYYVQARTGGYIDTYKISTDGLIKIMNSTANSFVSSDYHFISTSFII